jgi:hypothetical protein
MTPRHLSALGWVIILLTILTVSCTPKADLAAGNSLPLADFSENSVEVSIQLTRTMEGYFLLEATFTPPPDSHLYGKDIPRDGVDGLGRPTLLEITGNSKMQALGTLMESLPAFVDEFESLGLLIYPDGPVTLSMPVSLPPGEEWVDDEVSVTFMACTAIGCKPPVIGKIVAVRVPGAEIIPNP